MESTIIYIVAIVLVVACYLFIRWDLKRQLKEIENKAIKDFKGAISGHFKSEKVFNSKCTKCGAKILNVVIINGEEVKLYCHKCNSKFSSKISEIK